MASPGDLSEEFARELDRELRGDPELRGEFFATDEYPTDDVSALREWVSEKISDAMPESKAITKFLKRHLKSSEVVACLREWS